MKQEDASIYILIPKIAKISGMKKYVFKNSERYAVWRVHGQVCYWCGEPLKLQETTVDHVIPEHLLEKPAELAAVLEKFGLPTTFQLNDFGNWLPAHDRCNKSKSGMPLKAAPMVLTIIEKLQQKAEKARKIEEDVRLDVKKGSFLAKLIVARDEDMISEAEIKEVFGLGIPGEKDYKAIYGAEFYLDKNRWKIVNVIGESQAMVTDGRVAGITPIGKNPDSSWICPTCKNYGPWNGVICCSCGRRSAPYDY